MKRAFRSVVIALCLAVGTSTAFSAADVRAFNVQGVKLGMKVADVQAALKVAAAPERLSDGTSRIVVQRPDGWKFVADFLPDTLGGGVFAVDFWQKLEDVPPDALVAAVQSKYGKPDDVRLDPGNYVNIIRHAEVEIAYGAQIATLQKLKNPKSFGGPTLEEDYRTLRFRAKGQKLNEVWVRLFDGPASVAHRQALKATKERAASEDAQKKAATIKF